MGDKSTEMAEDRTDWAEDRTVLAMERTFAGWMRTGMACVAIAVGLRAIFGAGETPYAPARIASSIFIVTSLFIYWSAQRKCKATLRRMDAHAVNPSKGRSVLLIALSLSIGSIIVGAMLWVIETSG